jgi:hypothetical protein
MPRCPTDQALDEQVEELPDNARSPSIRPANGAGIGALGPLQQWNNHSENRGRSPEVHHGHVRAERRRRRLLEDQGYNWFSGL